MLKEGGKSVTIVIGKRVGAAEDLAGGSSRGSSQAPVGGNAVSQGIERVVVSVVCCVVFDYGSDVLKQLITPHVKNCGPLRT